ncbi:MAG: TonB-dependent receptor [Bacteroidia bacterium]|nr:MAG: TonB-dependent receptor [Bacteroidia bacterium]
MKKIGLLMAICLFLPFTAPAQHTINGRIFDQDGNSLPGAHIVIVGTYQGVFSDRHGNYKLQNIARNEYRLSVSFLGYSTVKKDIRVEGDFTMDFVLERSATLTEEVVVSAVRAHGRAPVTHTNVSREEIAARNMGQDLPMLLTQTPSLIVSSDAGTGIGYTWMNIRGSDQSRINVTINGIPVNDAESHGVWWVNLPDIVSSVDDLQVQRGVGLSTHGAGAFGATINLKSTVLRDQTYAEINNSAGSFNTLRNTVQFGTGLINEQWAFDGRLSRITSDGYIDRASADLRSFYLSGGYYGQNTMVKALVFSGKETTYQAWNGVPSDSLETNRTFNPSGMFTDDEGNIRFYDNETDNYQQDHYQLHFSRQMATGLIANAALHYTYGRGYYEQFRENERFSRYDLPPVEIGDQIFDRSDLIRRRWLDNHFYGFTYSVNYNNFGGLEMILGGGYNQYDGDHFGEIIWARHALHTDIRHRYYDNNAFKKDFNTFLKTSYELLRGLNVFADMQYRYVSYSFLGRAWVLGEVIPLQQKVNYHFFNPKAGVSYEFNNFHSIYLFAGIANREPVRRDFTESSPESRPRPEMLRNIELGYRLQRSGSLLGLNLYLMDYKDQLVLTGEINDVGGFSRTNIDDSYRMGLELEARQQLNDRLTVSGNLTLSRNKINSFTEHSDVYDDHWSWAGTDIITYKNTDIAFSPSVIAAGSIQWTPLDHWQLHLENKYVGKQFIDNTMSSERMLNPYFVNNLRVHYSMTPPLIRELEFVFQVLNVFDVKYETNAWIYKGIVGDQGLVTIEDGYFPQAGRHFMAGINLRF